MALKLEKRKETKLVDSSVQMMVVSTVAMKGLRLAVLMELQKAGN